MSFVTGLMLIDAPASALNNLGSIPGARTDNTVGVKVIRTKEGEYPYVSAQAFRYWLRTTLENANLGWQAAPIYREKKVAYTDANPGPTARGELAFGWQLGSTRGQGGDR